MMLILFVALPTTSAYGDEPNAAPTPRVVIDVPMHDSTTHEALRLEGHGNTISCVEFSPDGKLLASGDYDGLVKIWSLKAGKLLKPFEIAALSGPRNSHLIAARSSYTRIIPGYRCTASKTTLGARKSKSEETD